MIFFFNVCAVLPCSYRLLGLSVGVEGGAGGGVRGVEAAAGVAADPVGVAVRGNLRIRL